MTSMTTDYAREYFKKSGIIYGQITREDIDELINQIKIKLEKHLHFPMTISKK